MGGESLKGGEHILITLPFPEPTVLLDRLRKKYPGSTIIYRSVYFHRGTFKHRDKVPDGRFLRRMISSPSINS